MKTKNPLLLVLFMMAALIVSMVNVQGSVKHDANQDFTYSMNAPPGEIIMIAIETPTSVAVQIVATPCMSYQIERGVSVPYLALISKDAITTYNNEKFECNIYYTIARIDFKPNILTGY